MERFGDRWLGRGWHLLRIKDIKDNLERIKDVSVVGSAPALYSGIQFQSHAGVEMCELGHSQLATTLHL